ncbi:MAG: Na+/H+ antiporter subunit E [Rhodospirillales bacterium]|nr:Na+/H+ antiporter subunit E [Rhodospirillales bacterium]MDP7651816.1 Na+/H+ antiporter subunit E [Rhodospirillales bacterium]
MRAFSLGLVLIILWLLLSGHTALLLLGLGLVSVLAVVLIAWRMDLVDPEGHPIHLIWRAIPYWAWLLIEIFKANIDVARAIVRPRMPIRPTVLRLKAGQKSDLGRVIYANSITLTPGTVTLAVEGETIEVHALTPGAAEGLLNGDMNRRAMIMEGLSDGAGETS